MTHSCTSFDGIVPFLQEITNKNTRESKENIPPPPFSHYRPTGVGKDIGKCFTLSPSAPPPHTSLPGGFGTPVANRRRPVHTGLTPGHKSDARCDGAACPANPNDVSLQSDGGDACCLFSSALPGDMASQLRLGDFFPGPPPALEPEPEPEPEPEALPEPEAEQRPTVTRVVAGTAPLVAVSGRRVPADKLHLLRATSPGRGGAPALVPSERPRPTAAVVRIATQAVSGRRLPLQCAGQQGTVILEFGKGVCMRFQANPLQTLPVVGRRYVADITSSRSPYDNAAYRDAGVCVCVQHHQVDDNGLVVGGERTIYDGVIVREILETSASDAFRISELKSLRETAIVECLKHFRFLNMPFEVEDVHYTFDNTICIVYYRIKPQEGTSSQPNISRLLRMLQFKLQRKVYLKTGAVTE